MRLWLTFLLALSAAPAWTETIRIATFNANLSRSAPGLLLKDLQKPAHDQIDAVVEIIQRTAPDILLINEFDYDLMGEARDAFVARLASGDPGIDYAFSIQAPSNTGKPSGLDLNGDGTSGTANDAYGFGQFPGQYGMLLLSRYPIEDDAMRSFRLLKWADLPWTDLPVKTDGTPFPSQEAQAAMRLSSKSHWDVQVRIGEVSLTILASHPTPPVFDGPEDMNGKRNRDEILLWHRYINGDRLPSDNGETVQIRPGPFVILGDLNADPEDGDGIRQGIGALLGDPKVQDVVPGSEGGLAASAAQGDSNESHNGDPANDTADWRDNRGPGNLRVDYVLPSSDLTVTGTGVFWPTPDDPLFRLIGSGKPVSSDHRLVWVDISLP